MLASFRWTTFSLPTFYDLCWLSSAVGKALVQVAPFLFDGLIPEQDLALWVQLSEVKIATLFSHT
jgi:hypothetical protein